MEEKRRGGGWIIFAGILMILSGVVLFLNGLWAFNASKSIEATFKDTLLFSDNNIDVWGWIYVIVGLVVAAAGIAVFSRAQWARWVGIIAASISMISAFGWVFNPNYWVPALVAIFLDVVVIATLSTYGGTEDHEEFIS
jgi:sulfite exporter TauE/SafE